MLDQGIPSPQRRHGIRIKDADEIAQPSPVPVIGAIAIVASLEEPAALELRDDTAGIVGAGCTDMFGNSMVDHLLRFDEIVWQAIAHLGANALLEFAATTVAARHAGHAFANPFAKRQCPPLLLDEWASLVSSPRLLGQQVEDDERIARPLRRCRERVDDVSDAESRTCHGHLLFALWANEA